MPPSLASNTAKVSHWSACPRQSSRSPTRCQVRLSTRVQDVLNACCTTTLITRVPCQVGLHLRPCATVYVTPRADETCGISNQ